MAVGRPTSVTLEAQDRICERLSSGESLRTICADEDMPSQHSVFRALSKDLAFREKYTLAREHWSDAVFEETLQISDDGENDSYIDEETGERKTDWDVLGRSKLRIDTRKWALARMSPRKYGDKIQQEISNPDGSLNPTTASEAQVAAKLDAIRIAVTQRLAAPTPVEDPNDASDIA